jgi:hypothetical protein
MRTEIVKRSIGATSEIREVFQLVGEALGEQAQRLNQLRTDIAHAQAAEEISRGVQESGAFLYSMGSEAHLIARAAGQLSQFEQRLLASLAPFKLSEAAGPLPNTGNLAFEDRFGSPLAQKPLSRQ